MDIIDKAIKEGRATLSEFEAKQLLTAYRIPVTREKLVENKDKLLKVAASIGYPLVLKGCSAKITHKTEKGLIHLDIRNDDEALSAFQEITLSMKPDKASVLVQEMVRGKRELTAGLIRDAQFGPCVMFGLGGIFTEILRDTSFRIAPLGKSDALEMMLEIRGHKILTAVRGLEAVELDLLADILINLGRLALAHEQVKEIDINPIIISGSRPVVADALIIVDQIKKKDKK
ncbi:MAG: acetate--CoA ligase family protein [Deltaproteobacteria bacterium]|nr:acetate--CoA ligase family protein [Candidatus Tharpella sp.]